MKNPLCNPGNVSLTTDWKNTDCNQVDDEFCHGHSDHLRRRCERQERQWDARHALAEFSEFVKREHSTVLPAMGAIASTATPGAAAELLGTTTADFCRMRSRLRQLGKSFMRDEPVLSGSVQEFVRPQLFVGFLSMNAIHEPRLEHDRRPLSPCLLGFSQAFHRGPGSLSGPAGVGRPAESRDSGFGECP